MLALTKICVRFQPDAIGDPSLLSTSPPGLSLGQQVIPSLSPGELIRNSGKFPKPTKIPGKTYSKDEIVIRNADSGKGKIVCFTSL